MPSKANDKANNGQGGTNPPSHADGGTAGRPSVAATADGGTPGTPNALSGQHRLPPELLATFTAGAAADTNASSGEEDAGGDDPGRLAPGLPKNGNLERTNSGKNLLSVSSNQNENDLAVGLLDENSPPFAGEGLALPSMTRAVAPPPAAVDISDDDILDSNGGHDESQPAPVSVGVDDDNPSSPGFSDNAQTAASFEDVENSIKRFLIDAVDNFKTSQKNKAHLNNEGGIKSGNALGVASTKNALSSGEDAGEEPRRLVSERTNSNLERTNSGKNLLTVPSNQNIIDSTAGPVGEISPSLAPDAFQLAGEEPPVNDDGEIAPVNNDGSSATDIVTPTSTNTNIMQLEIPEPKVISPPLPFNFAEFEDEDEKLAPASYMEPKAISPPLPFNLAEFQDEDEKLAPASYTEPKAISPPLPFNFAKFEDGDDAAMIRKEKKNTTSSNTVIEESQTSTPTAPSSSSDIHHRPPTAPQVSPESPSPRAAPSENSQTQSRRGQRQAAAVIHRPPPRSMAVSLNDEARPPSVPNFYEVEASIVPDIPVYDAVQVPNEDNTPRPCWKRHQRWIFGGGVLIVGGVAMALGLSLGANNREVGEQSVKYVVVSTSPSVRTSTHPSLRPSNSFVPSPNPSLRPTNEPTRSIAPSTSLRPSTSSAPSAIPTLRPSNKPSTSFSPSTYLSSLIWKQQGQEIVGDAACDVSGTSVALSANGNNLAIGSPGYYYEEDRPGRVKVYHREDTESSWELVHTMAGSVDGDRFGISVSFSGDGTTLAIGAPRNGSDDRPGYVKVYFTEGGGSGRIWQQLGEDIKGETFGDEPGSSVSLSGDGNVVAIGAPHNNGVDGVGSGHVRVYGVDGNGAALSWKQLGQDIDGEAAYDRSGYSISLSADGKTLAIGAPSNDGNGDCAGHVRVYHMVEDDTGPIWKQLGQDIDGKAAFNYAGKSVSLSVDGKTLAIGAPWNGGNGKGSGYVRVYRLEGDDSSPHWKQFGQDIEGEAAYDESGKSVSLSADGKILAIGAPHNNSYRGYVRVYHIDEVGTQPIWKQLGHDIRGEIAYDQTGASVSLSADGKTVAIGSPVSSKNVEDSGHVSVFNIDY